MVAVTTHFDGKQIAVPKELRGAPAGEVIVVFAELPERERAAWLKAQQRAFAKVWENEEDALYDSL